MKEKTIEVEGFKVDLVDFGYGKYYYPNINPYAEFAATKKGYKSMRRYLKTLKYFEQLAKNG